MLRQYARGVHINVAKEPPSSVPSDRETLARVRVPFIARLPLSSIRNAGTLTA